MVHRCKRILITFDLLSIFIAAFVFRDFESLIHRGAFNEAGGLHHSTVIEKSLVDHFVPFLPMERRHVRQCVQAEAGDRYLTDEVKVYMEKGSSRFWSFFSRCS
jgi:hypothetical protein